MKIKNGYVGIRTFAARKQTELTTTFVLDVLASLHFQI